MATDQPELTRNDGVFIAHRVSELTSTSLASASMVLPFLFTAFSGPAVLAGLLLPVFRVAVVSSGAAAAPAILTAKHKRTFMAGGMALSLIGVLLVAGIAGPQSAPWVLVALFFPAALLMGVGSGVHSIAEKSVMANLWPVARRGSLMGTTQALAGVFLVAVAVLSLVLYEGETSTASNLHMVWGAVATAGLAAVLAMLVDEGDHSAAPRPAARDKPGLWQSAKASYASVARQSWYRRFICARVLLVSVEYGTAFYAIHAAQRHASAKGALAEFAVATAFGVVVGGLISRHVMRRSERMGLVIGGLFGCIAALGALLGEVDPQFKAIWLYAGTFFLLSIGVTCVNTGRNAYFLACVAKEDRENGLAMTKIIMEPANITFVVVMGALAQFQQPAAPIAAILLLGAGGVIASLTLPPSRQSQAGAVVS